jgi:hypothetical protein
MAGYELTQFGKTYASVQNRTNFAHLTFPVGQHLWIIDYLDVVDAFVNPKGDNNDLYRTLPECWLERLNTPTIIVHPM